MAEDLTLPKHEEGLEQKFLNLVTRNKLSLTVFLVNGVKLQGQIMAYNGSCLLLGRDDHVQIVYRHAISTILPLDPLPLNEIEVSELQIDE